MGKRVLTAGVVKLVGITLDDYGEVANMRDW